MATNHEYWTIGYYIGWVNAQLDNGDYKAANLAMDDLLFERARAFPNYDDQPEWLTDAIFELEDKFRSLV